MFRQWKQSLNLVLFNLNDLKYEATVLWTAYLDTTVELVNFNYPNHEYNRCYEKNSSIILRTEEEGENFLSVVAFNPFTIIMLHTKTAVRV